MTPLLRLVDLARLASLLALAPLVACSGATKQSVETAPADPPAAGGDQATQGAGSNANGSTNGNANGNGSIAASEDAGSIAPPTGSAGGCPAGAAVQEGHGSTAFTTLACGTVAPGSTDRWSFSLPKGATTLSVDYTGKVTLDVTTHGDTIRLGSGAALPFNAGSDYDIAVTTDRNEPEAYVITVDDP